MGIFFRNGNYWIDYREKGKRIRKQIGSEENAKTVLKILEEGLVESVIEIAEKKLLETKRNTGIKFNEAVEKYVEWAKTNKISWLRDKQSLAHWQEEFQKKKLSEICKLDIERYKARRKEEVAPRTVNEELACLRRLFYRMMEWGLAESNPVKGVKFLKEPPGRIAFLSIEEEKRLIDACPDNLKPIVIVALDTGMRKSEILNLKWQDIDFNREVIIVRNSKNGESREIPMTNRVKELLTGLSRYGENVFCSKNGASYKSLRSTWESFHRAVLKAGLNGLRFHDLRHVFATNLRSAGADLADIKECLGHKTLAMTNRYAHVTNKRKKDVIKLLDSHYLDTEEAKVLTMQNGDKV